MIGRVARSLGVEVSELLDDSPSESTPPTIIMVEDEPIILTGFIHILEDMLPDIQTFGFITAEEAVRFAGGTRVDVAFLDIDFVRRKRHRACRRAVRAQPAHEYHLFDRPPGVYQGSLEFALQRVYSKAPDT